jgi:microcystin-dependent protein
MSRALSRAALVVAMFLSLLGVHRNASAQSQPFLGQIMCAAFNFEPRGWMALDGRLLAINTNQALFALLGTTYGGNGQTTFAIPDMRGRVVISNGQGPGLSNRTLGEASGSEQVTLSTAQLPMHAHLVTPQGSPSDASLQSPADAVPATKARTTLYAPPSPTPVPMSPVITSTAGSSAPVSLMQPYVTLNCFIAVEGIFPSRN